ncbi:MAG: PleD family two-component system response regulator [Chthoniobacteraceae bacterium]
MKIIVAEDDPITREIIVKILKNLNHEVRAYPSGDEAWAANEADPAEVLFSDWVMPGLDGLELCKRLRHKQSKTYTYFILATGGRTSNEDHDAAVRAGVDDFLLKPINPDEVWRRLFVARRFLDFTRHLRRVRALLPACSVCKKIRDDNAYWHDFEAYIQDQPDTDADTFICPDCQHAQEEAAAKHR